MFGENQKGSSRNFVRMMKAGWGDHSEHMKAHSSFRLTRSIYIQSSLLGSILDLMSIFYITEMAAVLT
jgi:hypothetical protein